LLADSCGENKWSWTAYTIGGLRNGVTLLCFAWKWFIY